MVTLLSLKSTTHKLFTFPSQPVHHIKLDKIHRVKCINSNIISYFMTVLDCGNPLEWDHARWFPKICHALLGVLTSESVTLIRYDVQGSWLSIIGVNPSQNTKTISHPIAPTLVTYTGSRISPLQLESIYPAELSIEPSWAIADKINISTDYPEIHTLSDHNVKMIDITNFGQDIECNVLFCSELIRCKLNHRCWTRNIRFVFSFWTASKLFLMWA